MLLKGLYGIAIAIMISVLLFVSGCHYYSYSPEKRMDWMLKKFGRELKLTETQKGQLDRFKRELLIKGRELWVAYLNTKEEVVIQLRSDEFDQEHLKDVIAKNTAKREALISLFITRLGEFHSNLTPEQRTKLVKKLEKMKKWTKRYCRFSR